ncbi:MAG TPA: hypothetical protein VGJ07_32345, partial [Rugosimonospora sp.]
MRLPNVRLRVTAAVTPHNAGTAAWANWTLTPHAFHAIRLHAIRRITQGRTATVTRSGGATTATSSEPTAPTPGAHVLAPANITIQVAATGPGAGDSIATVDFDPWTRQDAFGAAIP